MNKSPLKRGLFIFLYNSFFYFCTNRFCEYNIVESFPVYLVSEKLCNLLKETELTGFEFDNCETETSETFKTLQPDKTLPKFYWLKITGNKNNDDFWINEDNILTISESAYELIKQTNINNCDIEELNNEIPTIL